MKTKQTPQSVNIIYWITNIGFWIYLLVSVFAFFLAMGFITGWVHNIDLNIGMPLALDLSESGVIQMNGETFAIQFNQLYGNMQIADAPTYITRTFGIFMIIILFIFLYIFQTFREFIKTIYKGSYFDRKNIMLLKRIAYALVISYLLNVLNIVFQYFYLVRNIELETAHFSGNFETYPVILLVSLFIWVLSHVFQKGVELQNENELTI